jgi:hypothetical protein
MTAVKRLAGEKLKMFEALAAYANMGSTPADWKKFRLMYPDFFPNIPEESANASPPRWSSRFKDLTEWMYGYAEECFEAEKRAPASSPSEFCLPPLLPPLLWYRNRLRSVWANNDQHAYSLAVLLGFEEEARRIESENWDDIDSEPTMRPGDIPGQRHPHSMGLPQGRPLLNGVSGEIRWEFGCDLQRGVYELMKERWRAKICTICGRYFIAMKTAQKMCSGQCSGEAARDRALTWWNEQGKKRREKARTK